MNMLTQPPLHAADQCNFMLPLLLSQPENNVPSQLNSLEIVFCANLLVKPFKCIAVTLFAYYCIAIGCIQSAPRSAAAAAAQLPKDQINSSQVSRVYI